MSRLLLTKFAGVLVYFKIVGLLMVIILRGLSLQFGGGATIPLRFPLWSSILVKIFLTVVLHKVRRVTM
jgi:hypothetical protein